MTGEVYAVLKSHSILGRMMEEGSNTNADAFRRGVERSGEPGGLLQHLFGVRTKGLMDELLYVASPPAGATRLSEWTRQHSSTLGPHYSSEFSRRRNRKQPYRQSP